MVRRRCRPPARRCGREKSKSRSSYRGRGPLGDAPLAHRRPGYPLTGCSPAEPASVSPGGQRVASSGLPCKAKDGGRTSRESMSRALEEAAAATQGQPGATTPAGFRPAPYVAMDRPCAVHPVRATSARNTLNLVSTVLGELQRAAANRINRRMGAPPCVGRAVASVAGAGRRGQGGAILPRSVLYVNSLEQRSPEPDYCTRHCEGVPRHGQSSA